MSAQLSAIFGAGAQLFNNTGSILASGKIYTYLAGTTTLASTWTDSTQVTANANPIILDTSGRVPNEIWTALGIDYKFVLKDSASNTLGTWDNIPGIPSGSGSAASPWTLGNTATYISSVSFSVVGDQTAVYQIGRRVQYYVAAGVYYGTITNAVYGSVTTVTITPDSVGLDSSVTAINYGQTVVSVTTLTGTGTGVQTFLATPSSANLRAALTDETGTGAAMFNVNPTITNYVETTSVPAANSAFTVDLANGTKFEYTTNANVTITLPSPLAGKSYTVRIKYGGTHTVTWAGGGTLKWSGGVQPTSTSVAGKYDTYTFDSDDAVNTFGVSGGANA